MVSNRLSTALFFSGSVLVLSACGPTYPKCENDDHCAEKGEFCVNGLCQQCRDNSHCEGPGMACSGGKCTRRPGYCDETTACPGNMKCRDNECGPECLSNDECGGGNYCRGGACVARPECGEDAINPACPEGQDCLGGRCQIRIARCGTEPVYFDFDQATIRADQRAKVDGVAACVKNNPINSLTIEGHADERGTNEYNLALGERRAQAVRKYLSSLGISADKLNTVSFGEERPAAMGSNEDAWSRNRRTEFQSR